jgi:2-phospho-L-lactate guanylyltransferase (CobY/MobA/RfbA family)
MASAIAASYFVPTVADARAGLNLALANARNELVIEGHKSSRLTILAIDLSYATVGALSAAIDIQADVVICPDEGKVRFPFSFRADSCGTHSNAARADELSFHVINDERLARDIDEPGQYLAWTKSFTFPRHLLTRERVEPFAGSTAPI